MGSQGNWSCSMLGKTVKARISNSPKKKVGMAEPMKEMVVKV